MIPYLKFLKRHSIPGEIIDDIVILLTNRQATVLAPDGETDPFDILAGMLKSDTLAPFLSIIGTNFIMCLSVDSINGKGLMYQSRKRSHYPANYITDADFADAIC